MELIVRFFSTRLLPIFQNRIPASEFSGLLPTSKIGQMTGKNLLKTGKFLLPGSKIPNFFFPKTSKNPLKNPLVTYGKLGNFLKKDKNSQQKWLGDSLTEESGRKETDSKEGNKFTSMIDVETKSTRRAFSGIN